MTLSNQIISLLSILEQCANNRGFDIFDWNSFDLLLPFWSYHELLIVRKLLIKPAHQGYFRSREHIRRGVRY
jgi:hypothetical protein